MSKNSSLNLVYSNQGIELYLGDCQEVLPTLKNIKPNGIFASVITSPPYSNQRILDYKSIHPEDYPGFTYDYFEKIRPLLLENGSIFLVVRPNIKNGEIDDFVLRTRLKLRESWKECEELIWIKPNSPPLGSIHRPRRSWESILWFGKTGNVFCNAKASNITSNRIGFEHSKFEHGNSFINYGQKSSTEGIARDPDFITVGTQCIENGVNHPAMFPVEIPEWLIKLSTKEQQIVLDPFMGSGSTAIACIKTGRKFVGIETDPYYIEEAIKRIEREMDKLNFEKNWVSHETEFLSSTVKNNTIISF